MRLRAALLIAAATAAGGATFAVAADGPAPQTYGALKGDYVGVKPTAVGLPQIGAGGQYGAGEMTTALRNYHDAGLYDQDLEAVGSAAKTYLQKRIDQNGAPAKQVCKRRYLKIKGKQNRFRRARVCKIKVQQQFAGKAAIVLDIDETSLSNYQSLVGANFTAAGLVPSAALGQGTAIAPTLDLFKLAKENGIAVFFITGRPEAISGPTSANLTAAGYENWDGLIFKPGGVGTEAYKAGEREKLAQQGYDIVLNVGDQESDLDGGFADRAFKLPNPFYFIADE